MRLPPIKGRRLLTVVASVAFVGLIAVTASATHSFLDVPDTHTFHSDIEWMKDTGVTRGCNPPANTEYCPDDFVTRGQMAAFFHRFAQAGVADAGTLEGKQADDFLDTDGKASDSDLLDGKDSTEFLGVNDKAADSDLLDGKDSTEFLGVNDKAADSDLLDGLDSTDFVQVGDGLGGALAASIYTATETEAWVIGVFSDVVASCDAGDVLIGGGYETGGLLGVNVTDSFPDGEAWTVQGTATVLANVTAYAICVSA
jgi:hypothetical protein